MYDYPYALQLFADGGAAGSAGASGASGSDGGAAAAPAGDPGVNADPGRQRLLELGVPASKLRKNRVYGTAQPQAKPQAQQPEQAPSVPETAEKNDTPTGEKPSRMSWEDIKADPEYADAYKKEMSAAVQKRLKNSKNAESTLEALTPALGLMAKKYGLDPTADGFYQQLGEAINKDDSVVEDRALDNGVSVDAQRKMDQDDIQRAITAQRQREQRESDMFDRHYQSLQQQATQLREQYPDFNLDTELRNPVFARMTAPGGGVPLADAYFAVHRQEIQQATERRAQEQMANAIRSNSNRPRETGSPAQTSPAVNDYRNLTPQQRAEFKRRIMATAATGAYLKPGSF